MKAVSIKKERAEKSRSFDEKSSFGEKRGSCDEKSSCDARFSESTVGPWLAYHKIDFCAHALSVKNMS